MSETIDFLQRRDPTVPFFLWMSFHRPHAPFNPPQWAFDQYVHGPRVVPPVGDWVDDFEEFRRDDHHQTTMGRLDPESHHRTTSGYYGNITHIDLQLNRLFETLADHELADDTTIVFVSDHGDMMGDHDMYRKGVGFEGSAHVPMIIKPAPRFSAGIRAGQVVTDVTELRDLMPTVLELAGVPVPDSVDGRSLVPHLRGERPSWRAEIHGEHAYWGQSLQWLTDGRRKYLWSSAKGLEHFFDMEADPQERHNLAHDQQWTAEVAQWRQRLVTYLTGREEGFVLDGVLVSGRPVQTEAGRISALVG